MRRTMQTNRLTFRERMAAIRRQRIVARNKPIVTKRRVQPQRRIPVIRNDANWGISLVIDNDQATYNAVQALKEQSADAYEFSDQLRAYFDEIYDQDSQGLSMAMSQLLMTAYQSINWDTLAQEIYNEE